MAGERQIEVGDLHLVSLKLAPEVLTLRKAYTAENIDGEIDAACTQIGKA